MPSLIEKTYKNEDGYIKVFIYLTPNGEKFRWYTAFRVEKQLFTENETFQTMSKETGEKFNSIVKELITELKEKINL